MSAKQLVIVLLLSVLPITSAFGAEEPRSEVILGYLKQQLPDHVEVTEFEYKNFRGADEGIGRTSAIGRLTLTTNTLAQEPDAISRHLAAMGWSWNEIDYHARIIGKKAILNRTYAVVHRKGEDFEFSAEFRYQATIRGFRFFGAPRYQKFAGIPKEKLPIGALIVGTSPYQMTIEQFKRSKARLHELQVRAKDHLEGIFADTTFDFIRTIDGQETKEFSLKASTGASWHKSKRGPDLLTYSLRAVSRWPEGGRWANSRYSAKEQVPMLLRGKVRAKPQTDGWTITLELLVPKKSGNGFYNTAGFDFVWVGKHFGGRGLLRRGKLRPRSSATRGPNEPPRQRLSELSPGSTIKLSSSAFNVRARSGGLFELQLWSIRIDKDELTVTLRLTNRTPKAQYLIFVTSNEDKRYGQKLFITDNFGKKYYAKNGLEGEQGIVERFNNSASRYIMKANTIELVNIRFPMVAKGVDTINLFSRRIHGHQDPWWIKDIWLERKR